MSKQNNWYTIRQHTPVAAAAKGVQSAAEILIYGDIGETWWSESVSAANFVRELVALSVEAITIRINSYGGSVVDGIAIHNAIKRHPAQVTTCVDGIAASIASLIAMAGDTRDISENAMLMLHAPWGGIQGNAVQMREYADMLDTWGNAMATSYARASGMKDADVLALLSDGKDHWYTAAEAQAAGFAHNVIGATPEAASAMASLSSFDLTRYRTAPASLVQRIAVAAATQPVAHSAAAFQEIYMTGQVNPSAASAVPTVPAAVVQPAALPQASLDAANAALQVAARSDALTQDAARRTAIRASFKFHAALPGVAALQTQCEDDHAISADAAGLRLLAHIGSGASPIAGNYRNVTTVQDEADKVHAGMQQAIFARANVQLDKSGPVRADTANPYRGMRLLDMARASLVRAGINVEGMEQMRVVAQAFTQSASDFPVLLENTMNKLVQSAYALRADSWTRFCNRGTVSDFRAHNRYRLGSLSNLDVLNELGEFKNKAIPDGEKSSIIAATKGNIINISRQTIINDDLGAFTSLAMNMGRAAKRTVEADAYATLALNSGMGPLLADGLSLFHASHNNIIASGTAPTVTAFDAMRVILAAQRDVSGNDFLDLVPAIWLGPIGLEGAAKVVVNSTYDPDSNNKLQRTNIAAGMVADIVGTPRLTGTPYYMFANPSEAPVLEVAFLDGNDTPYLELMGGFEVDGASWKVRLDYGVAGIDFRGAIRNAGA